MGGSTVCPHGRKSSCAGPGVFVAPPGRLLVMQLHATTRSGGQQSNIVANLRHQRRTRSPANTDQSTICDLPLYGRKLAAKAAVQIGARLGHEPPPRSLTGRSPLVPRDAERGRRRARARGTSGAMGGAAFRESRGNRWFHAARARSTSKRSRGRPPEPSRTAPNSSACSCTADTDIPNRRASVRASTSSPRTGCCSASSAMTRRATASMNAS